MPTSAERFCSTVPGTRPKLWRLENAKWRLVDPIGHEACVAAECLECPSRNGNFGLRVLGDVHLFPTATFPRFESAGRI